MTSHHAHNPVRAILALELPSGTRFDESAVEWRRLFAEFFGTLMLVLVAAGASVVNAVIPGGVSPTARVVAPGLMVMALIYATGAVGGAHFNPAVTLCFAVRGNFPWIRVPGYILMQLLGAVAAATCLRALFGNVGDLGATLPSAGISDGQAVTLEIVLTLGLVSVVLGTARGKERRTNAALAVGALLRWPGCGRAIAGAREHGPNVRAEWSGRWSPGCIRRPTAGGLLAVEAHGVYAVAVRAGDEAAQGTSIASGETTAVGTRRFDVTEAPSWLRVGVTKL